MDSVPVIFFKHQRFNDSRGWLSNINASDFVSENPERFVHGFIVHSVKNTLRGFHFQKPPQDQEKIVHVLKGEILDVSFCLDDTTSKPELYSCVLGDNCDHDTAHITPNMAHAYFVLSDSATLLYLNTAPYDPVLAQVIHPLDPEIQCDWGVTADQLVISGRDKNGMSFAAHRRGTQ